MVRRKTAKSGDSAKKPRFKRLRGVFNYFKEARQELKKVTWPSRKEAWKLTFAVLIFTAFFTILTLALDSGFSALAERLFL